LAYEFANYLVHGNLTDAHAKLIENLYLYFTGKANKDPQLILDKVHAKDEKAMLQ